MKRATESHQRFCCYCARQLQGGYFALVLDADGKEVKVHKDCAGSAARFWKKARNHFKEVT